MHASTTVQNSGKGTADTVQMIAMKAKRTSEASHRVILISHETKASIRDVAEAENASCWSGLVRVQDEVHDNVVKVSEVI